MMRERQRATGDGEGVMRHLDQVKEDTEIEDQSNGGYLIITIPRMNWERRTKDEGSEA
jgi:hypothetical protein